MKIVGALYLAWLAWSMVRPGGRSPFERRDLAPEADARLFGMGLLPNLLNPTWVAGSVLGAFAVRTALGRTPAMP